MATDRHGFLTWSAGFTQSDTILNDLLDKLEVKVGASVISRTTTAQPGSPTAGDMYIIPASATGAAWSTFNEHDITIYRSGAWVAFTPIKGWPSWVEDDANGVMFNGTAWTIVSGGLLNKYDATTAPTTGDDTGDGYSPGSQWVDVTNDKAYVCLDATAAAAVWTETTQTGGAGSVEAIYPVAFMRFDGSTTRYSMNTHTSSGNKMTAVARFKRTSFTGAGSEFILRVDGPTNYQRISLYAIASDHADSDKADRIAVQVKNSAGTVICQLFGAAGSYLDGKWHTAFVEFDGDAGTAVFRVDGVDADDSGNADRVAPTTGTLDSGASSDVVIGASGHVGGSEWGGDISYIGFHETSGLSWSDFMDASGNPKVLDEETWTEWGTQPKQWNPNGQMIDNRGSDAALTETGAIVLIAS